MSKNVPRYSGGYYRVKFGRVKIAAKKKNHDGTESVPSWYRNCTIMENIFSSGRGFGRFGDILLRD